MEISSQLISKMLVDGGLGGFFPPFWSEGEKVKKPDWWIGKSSHKILTSLANSLNAVPLQEISLKNKPTD